MENWKLHLAGIRNALNDLVTKTFNINGSVEVSNLPDVQRVEITNLQEPLETVKVSNLVDYKEDLNKIIGELIKVPKDIKTADYTPIIKALQEVVKTLEADKADYSPIILSIESAVKELKTQYPEVDYSPIINTIKGIQQFNLSQYLEEGELPVIINEKQIKKLVDAFGKKTGQVIATMAGGGSSSNVTATIDTTGLATSTIQTDGSQKTKVIDSAGTIQDWVMPEGQEASANSMPMVLSTEQEAILTSIDGKDFLTETTFNTIDFATESTLSNIALESTQTDIKTAVESIALEDFATQTTLAALLTELQAKADLSETQPVSLASVPSHAVTNAGTFAVQSTLQTGSALAGDVGIQPRTSGGLLIGNFTSGDGSTALTSTAQVIKATAGQLFGWYIFNPNTVTAWVIIYNTAAASVTVGTTSPAMVLGIPAGSAANVVNPIGIQFTNAGWSIAAVMTSAAGNTAPTVALDCMVFYK